MADRWEKEARVARVATTADPSEEDRGVAKGDGLATWLRFLPIDPARSRAWNETRTR